MKLFQRICTLSLCAALTLPTGAQAEERYPDLSDGHWAYEDMDRAVGLGIIKGMEDGRMAPEETLTWGQYLTMLARAFFPEDYAAYLEAGQEWDQAGYQTALGSGLLLEEDFLPVDPADLWAPITRQDAAVLLDRALPDDGWRWPWGSHSITEIFPDCEALRPEYHEPLLDVHSKSILKGREDGTFGVDETIRRSDGTVLLLRTLYEVDMRAEKDVTVTLHIVDQQGTPLTEPQVVDTQTGQYTYGIVDENYLWHYTCISDNQQVSSYQSDYTLVYRPYTRREAAQEDFYAAVERGELSYEDYRKQDFNLWELGENPRKSLLLFGSEEQLRFPDRATAEENMTTVTVPVWKLNRAGEKVEGTLSFSIHSALAEDVTAIFTEIFNDPEQFPFKDAGGFSWRGDSSRSEHNSGTAIDLNWDENYQIRDGAILAGSLWEPGENPYSIGPDSSVVRIFEEYGWAWGGDAWAYDSDDSQGYHDYMHFSYLGT